MYLRLDQDQIDEEHYEVVLHVFICEALASWTLRQAHALAQRAVVGFAVRGVECFDGIPAGDADWHCNRACARVVACADTDMWWGREMVLGIGDVGVDRRRR